MRGFKSHELQNVVEGLEQTQLRGWPTAASGIALQDKFVKQSEAQLRGNRLPMATSSHSETAAEYPALRRVACKFDGS
jgi:hypothetical protein